MKVRFMARGVDPIAMTVRAPARNPPWGESHGIGGLRFANPPYALKVSRRNGGAFVVIGAEDWEREQETLYVLQNPSLMAQIARSAETYALGTGRRPTPEELSEIDCL